MDMKESIKVLRREYGVEKVVASVSSLKEGCNVVKKDIKENGYEARRFRTYNKAYDRVLVDIGNSGVSYMLNA